MFKNKDGGKMKKKSKIMIILIIAILLLLTAISFVGYGIYKKTTLNIPNPVATIEIKDYGNITSTFRIFYYMKKSWKGWRTTCRTPVAIPVRFTESLRSPFS